MERSRAFAPGHVTGFFSIHDSADDVAMRGSRGAGFCVDLGSHATVELADSNTILVNGLRSEMKVLTDVVEAFTRSMDTRLKVSIENGLPLGQGFGMSGAMALSTAMAAAKLLGSDVDPILAAHTAEVLNGTGLGDVAAQSVGGFEIRMVEGVPPHGRVENLDIDVDVVYLRWVEEPMSTPAVLRNPDDRKRIIEAGAEAHSALTEEPTLENFCRSSRRFADSTGLIGPHVRKIIGERKLAGMCMLGHSAFSFEELDGAVAAGIGPAAHLI